MLLSLCALPLTVYSSIWSRRQRHRWYHCDSHARTALEQVGLPRGSAGPGDTRAMETVQRRSVPTPRKDLRTAAAAGGVRAGGEGLEKTFRSMLGDVGL
jgi:hypothetical protein